MSSDENEFKILLGRIGNRGQQQELYQRGFEGRQEGRSRRFNGREEGGLR
jgi:hypothetical protein